MTKNIFRYLCMSCSGPTDHSTTGRAQKVPEHTSKTRHRRSSPPYPGASASRPSSDTVEQTTAGASIDDARSVSPYSGKHQSEAAERLEAANRLGTGRSRLVGLASNASATADRATVLLGDVASGLKTLSRVGDIIGDIHPYLRAAMSILSGITKPIIHQDARDAAFEDMLKEMMRTYELAQGELNLQNSVAKIPVSYEMKLLAEIARASEECARFIADEYVTKRFLSRAAKNTFLGADIDDRILRFKTQFATLRERWRDAKLKYLEANAVLNRLHFVRGAGLARDQVCLAGTRTDILHTLTDWVDHPSAAPVRFLIGVAGCGKSTIANTLAVELRARNHLAVFFAFDRNAGDRVPRRLLCTIAYELALWNEGYRDSLVTHLKDLPGLEISSDIAEQWEHLILRPAAALASAGPVLLVVDAFDECPGGAEDRSRRRLLDVFTSNTSRLPANFRVLITSRAEPELISATLPSQRIDIADVLAGDDIRLYVRSRLPCPDKGGLSDVECQELARCADGLFQWAATACAFLEQRLAGTTMRNKYRFYSERLMRGQMGLEYGRPSLNHLYLTVLESTFDSTDPYVMHNFRMVLSLILCATRPLSITALCAIYSLEEGSRAEVISAILGAMGVVLQGTSDPSSPIRPMHASFRDFLLDDSRSGCWRISPADLAAGHKVLSIGTLRVMERELTFENFCTPPPVAQSRNPRDRLIGLPAGLLYSSLSWAYHLSHTIQAPNETSTGRDDTILATARHVLLDKFLFWIALLGAAGESNIALSGLDMLSKEFRSDPEFREFARDARRFMRFFKESIWASAPQVYLSALPFTPACSVIRTEFLPRFPTALRVTPVLPTWPLWTYWLEESPTEQHALITSISDSHIATIGPGDGLQLYEYPSGNCVGRGKGTGSRATSIAFSAARCLIATGHSSGLVYLWDSSTLHESGILGIPGGTAAVHSVAFAPDGSYVLSAHADGSTRQWHPENRQCVRTLDQGPIPGGLVWSRDSLRIFYGSRNGTIRVADLSRTDAAFSLAISGISAIGALSHSPTRNHLAVGLRVVSTQSCIEIWDADTFVLIGRLAGHRQAVECVSWSPDSRYIASSSRDGTVRLWDAVELKAVGSPAHVGGLGGRGVVFSPDGSIVHSSANLAGMHSFSLGDFLHLRDGPTLPSVVAYSTDGRYIKAVFGGSSPTTLYWNAQNGSLAIPPDDLSWRTRSGKSKDGRLTLLVVGRKIFLREKTDGQSVDTSLCDANGFLGNYDISPDGRCAVVITADKLNFWDLESRSQIGEPAPCGEWATNPTFAPDGREVAVATLGGIKIWAVDPQLDADLHSPPPSDLNAHLAVDLPSKKKYADGIDRCRQEGIPIPREYEPGAWYPRMRLLLGLDPVCIEFPGYH